MSKVISTIVFTFLITLVSTSPIPSIPIVILNYKINGLFAGYISTLVGGLIASTNQFFFSKVYLLNFIKNKYPKKYFYIKKYSKIISKMTHIEFMLFLFSGVIPNSIITVASGVAKMSFKKFITCYFIVALPQQLIFLLTASQLSNFQNLFQINGFDKFKSILLSLAIVSFLAFVFSFLSRVLPIFIKSKDMDN